jgi:hypothetical protein
MYSHEQLEMMFPIGRIIPLEKTEKHGLRALRRVAALHTRLLTEAVSDGAKALSQSLDVPKDASTVTVLRYAALVGGSPEAVRGTLVRSIVTAFGPRFALVELMHNVAREAVIDDILLRTCPECRLPPTTIVSVDMDIDGAEPHIIITAYRDYDAE